jgi:putative transposase
MESLVPTVRVRSAKNMARDRYKIKQNDGPHFLTCTVVEWLPISTRPRAVDIVLVSLRYLQSREGMILYGFVIMENHAHLIVSSENPTHTIGRFKSFTARKIIDLLTNKGEKGMLRQLKHGKLPHKTDREYQLWQEGSHPVLIQGREMMRQRLEYVHGNPLRRGYVDDPVH